MSNATDLAKMARDNGIETRKLANNSFSTDKIFQIGQGEFIGRNNTQTGNGNVNATQSYPDISLTSPLSAPFNATTAWRSLSAYLNQVAATNTIPASAVYAEYFGSLSVVAGGQNWEGGILATNGKIYCFPEQATTALKIDPENKTVTTFGSFPGGTLSLKFQGSVLAPNGKIYGVPCGNVAGGGGAQSIFYFIDPTTDSITAFATVAGIVGTSAYQGGVLHPNGRIYMAPGAGSVVHYIDPSTNTVVAYATISFNASGDYAKAVVAPNGKIYFGINSATLGRFFDPTTNTFGTFGPVVGFPANLASNGITLAPNGKLYLTPSHSIAYVIDPVDNSTTSYATGSSITGNIIPFGGKLAPNGKIYFTSWSGTYFGVLDPENLTVTRLGTVANLAYLDMVVTNTGKLVFIPAAASSVTVYNMQLNNNWNLNVAINPNFNKN
jgi:streptogramin lyase